MIAFINTVEDHMLAQLQLNEFAEHRDDDPVAYSRWDALRQTLAQSPFNQATTSEVTYGSH